LRIALNNGVTKEEVVELFIHLEAYAGAARAFDAYQVVLAVFAQSRAPAPLSQLRRAAKHPMQSD